MANEPTPQAPGDSPKKTVTTYTITIETTGELEPHVEALLTSSLQATADNIRIHLPDDATASGPTKHPGGG